MAIPEPNHTGTVDFNGKSTWYRITGEPGRTPLVVLHGGPGAGHNYTLSIAGIAEQGRQVVHYDQLGTGLSTHLPDEGADFWTVQLFLDELDNLLKELGIADAYHLLGQSWGGMLAAEHAVQPWPGCAGWSSPTPPRPWSCGSRRRPNCAPSSRPRSSAPCSPTRRPGPPTTPTTSPPSRSSTNAMCRLDPNPPEVQATWENIAADPTVYHTMNGPNEFHVVGTMKDWSVIDRLHLVEAPTLLVSGRYDEATPETLRPFADHIPDVRWHMFEHSSHMPHVEEEELYLQVVGTFLDSTD